MEKYVLIACGGALGAMGRAIVGEWIMTRFGPYPYGTIVVNILGCLLIGCLLGLYVYKPDLPQWIRWFFVVGGLGAFTTFSTFAFELLQLLMKSSALEVTLYGGLQIIGGIIVCGLGMWITRCICG